MVISCDPSSAWNLQLRETVWVIFLMSEGEKPLLVKMGVLLSMSSWAWSMDLALAMQATCLHPALLTQYSYLKMKLWFKLFGLAVQSFCTHSFPSIRSSIACYTKLLWAWYLTCPKRWPRGQQISWDLQAAVWRLCSCSPLLLTQEAASLVRRKHGSIPGCRIKNNS